MLQGNNVFSKIAQYTVWDYIISRGVIALLIGILFISWPGATINILCMLLGVFLLLNGLVILIKSLKSRKDKKIPLIYGFLCLLAGLLILINPMYVAGFFVIVFSLLVLISGINQLITAIAAKSIPGSARILAAVTGVISLILGISLLMRPNIGLQVITVLIGIYFLAFGVLAIATGTVLNKTGKDVSPI